MKEAILTNLYDSKRGRFVKAILLDGTRDATVDSSLAFTFLYGAYDAENEAVSHTMGAIMNILRVDQGIGGLARYENDLYHRVSAGAQGNPWIICTLWVARWHIAAAKP